MRTILQLVFAIAIAVFMIASPLAYKRWQDTQWRNFRVVEEGVLYRSGQMSRARLQHVIEQHGIRTVVCLREGNDEADKAEEAWVNAKALKFVRIPPRAWFPDSTGKVPAEINLQMFRDVMDDKANYPVLVHCFAGIHRTGSMVALFRMDYQGWTNEQALNEMRAMGYSILDEHEDIKTYIEQYPPQPRPSKLHIPIVPVSRQSAGNP